MEILVPEVESYLEGSVWSCLRKICVVYGISAKQTLEIRKRGYHYLLNNK